jgi:raffinose/stachyose/melibiose transport system permease protein
VLQLANPPQPAAALGRKGALKTVPPAAASGARIRRRRAVRVSAVVVYLVTFVVALPLLWIVLLSFESNSHILSDPFSIGRLSVTNYRLALRTLNLLLMYRNTFILAAGSVPVGIVMSFMASYALSRMFFKHRWIRLAFRNFFLAGLAVPVYILLFPVYRLDIMFHIFGTYLSLIVPYIAVSISFNMLLFTGFLADFPEELEQAAVVDGCGLYGLTRRVVFPLMKPVVATLFVFNIIYVWNEFPFAVTLINKSSLTTVALGISQFQGVWNVEYGAMMASTVLVLVPQLAVYAIFQRQVVAGMTAGAVKG